MYLTIIFIISHCGGQPRLTARWLGRHYILASADNASRRTPEVASDPISFSQARSDDYRYIKWPDETIFRFVLRSANTTALASHHDFSPSQKIVSWRFHCSTFTVASFSDINRKLDTPACGSYLYQLSWARPSVRGSRRYLVVDWDRLEGSPSACVF